MKKVCLFSCFLFSLSVTGFSQNVGIGTLTPNRAKLEVNGAIGSTNAIIGGDGTGISLQRSWPGIGFNEYITATAAKYIANGYASVQWLDQTTGNLSFLFFPNGNKDASVVFNNMGISMDVNGNMGIRANPTTATLYTAKVNNANGSAVFGGTNYNSHFAYDVGEDTYIRGGKSGSKIVINDITGGKVILGSSNSRVGINSGNPTYTLEIRQRSLGSALKMVQPSNNYNSWEFRMQHDSYYGPIDNLYFIYNGAYKLLMGCGDGTMYTFSDKRLKTNIQDMSPIMEKYMQLEPVQYNMKAFSSMKKKTAGFIAQDVQKLFPELVAKAPGHHGYEGIDTLLGLNYDGFRMLTIRAMQEQQQKIKEMQRQNELLEKRIAAAEALLKEEK